MNTKRLMLAAALGGVGLSAWIYWQRAELVAMAYAVAFAGPGERDLNAARRAVLRANPQVQKYRWRVMRNMILCDLVGGAGVHRADCEEIRGILNGLKQQGLL